MAVRISFFCDRFNNSDQLPSKSVGVMNKQNAPGTRRSMLTLPNFYVFMPTAGDKIEKISANRATVRTEEGGNCKTK